MADKVGVVLVNYRDYARKFLSACWDSLRAQDYPQSDFSIYIIDNASSRESLKYLQTNYPEAEILPRSDGNYVAANNLGFERALKDGCVYLVALNMDTEVDPHWLTELVAALVHNPEAALAQSKIMLYPFFGKDKANSKINSLGNVVNFLGFGFTSAYGEPDREIAGYPQIKGYVSGCSLIIRGSVWEEIGDYWEEIYMYHDDLELSLRARLAGYSLVLAPLSVVWHKYEFKRSTQMVYYMERNRIIFLLAFYPMYLLILIFLPALVMELGLLVFSGLRGWWPAKLKADAYFLNPLTVFKIARYRRRLNKIQKVSFLTLARDFSGSIDFAEIANPLLSRVVNPLFAAYWRLVKKII